MADFTTRTGLAKPFGTEQRSRVPLNANFDIIDKFLGCILVNDGVTPPTGDLFDGALVREKTSGILWEARKNGGGTFDKVYIRYPYHFEGDSNTKTVTDNSNGSLGFDTSLFVAGDNKNASVANINGSGEWVCPIRGIYLMNFNVGFAANASGIRGVRWSFNGTWILDNTSQVIQSPVSGVNTYMHWGRSKLFAQGDRVLVGAYQNSGLNIAVRGTATIDMLEPVQ